ncbi:ATP phosphoribosyltransferase regulatory subunit [Pseudooctadecabacter jejudonensis]|uniref:ATP phosphoribosyltransferase regulatory subunit n=1 Tax=Pseudooctadecabacter jejudonensis TaxID=1391910 RepID=A0A1Y5SYF6_9RHOB|nr:ATP phosphoribosyltransferase regulatory subunit [Pseudooctadecabacter jejudonensis]SLN51517.1 ATP phosphoribosyltransferase regulatory subunit [Pseudooctadecabacter jejudonensis]
MSLDQARLIWDRARNYTDVLTQQGAVLTDADYLQPADTLLDLYGEDIRARAFTTQDPARGEMMLRPDFTVPVVQTHMAHGAEPARYTYMGKVFRKQEDGGDRPTEFVQVGYEVFDGTDPAAADAEVFATIAGLLNTVAATPVTGDIGILRAAVRGLKTTERRRAALQRHLWRPVRFKALLDRFEGITPPSRHRTDLLAQADPMVDAPALLGLRSYAEITARIDALREDAAAAPVSSEERALLDALLAVAETAPNALSALRDIAVDLPSIAAAVDGFAARCDALAARGVAVETLMFEASFGRTSMEYYDGFVFGFASAAAPHLPPMATGGRYDALTTVLGGGTGVPAVGGVIRPALVIAAEDVA